MNNSRLHVYTNGVPQIAKLFTLTRTSESDSDEVDEDAEWDSGYYPEDVDDDYNEEDD